MPEIEMTPLMSAARSGDLDAVASIATAEGTDVNAATPEGVTAAHLAIEGGHMEAVKVLVGLGFATQRPVCKAGSLLHVAVAKGGLTIVGPVLYDCAVDVNAVDEAGVTPLMAALRAGNHEAVTFLLEHGADVTVAAKDKTTALHLAVEAGTMDEVKAILSRGGSAAAENAAGKTPAAIAQEKGNAAAAKELAKEAMPAAKKVEDGARFKAHGNRVFSAGENVKAAKFYTLAIQSEPTNHVYYSNRSACLFNTRQFDAALYDARRCVVLAPAWVKGYLRVAATLQALKRKAEAKAACEEGLKVDTNNAELKALLKQLQ